MDRNTAIATFEDVVPEGCECPECGESRIDCLIIVPNIFGDYEDVECATCGCEYSLEAGNDDR